MEDCVFIGIRFSMSMGDKMCRLDDVTMRLGFYSALKTAFQRIRASRPAGYVTMNSNHVWTRSSNDDITSYRKLSI